MTRDEAIGAYCRQTGRVLAAPKDRREELLAGLRQELEERFSGAEELTEGALYQGRPGRRRRPCWRACPPGSGPGTGPSGSCGPASW